MVVEVMIAAGTEGIFGAIIAQALPLGGSRVARRACVRLVPLRDGGVSAMDTRYPDAVKVLIALWLR
jgi:hypothetical protein